MARVVALGDAHLGRSHLAHLRDEEGRNLREEDFLRSFDWAVDTTLALEPDGFLWLGDIFDHARPSYRVFTRVLVALRRLEQAGIPGVAISGNHDTPRLRGTGSPYAALEEVFPNVTFCWRMEAVTVEVAGVRVHAVPQTLSVEDFRSELERSASDLRADPPSVLLAHVALTSLPASKYDINEIEVPEGAFDRRFDHVLLGHYHQLQKISRRTWYAGSTDSFWFSDRPNNKVGPKGLIVLDTATGEVDHHPNPGERPLLTFAIDAGGMGPGELLDAAGRAAAGSLRGAVVRLFLNEVDPAALRQVSPDDFLEAVPGALHVQVEPDFSSQALAVQAGPEIGRLEVEWDSYLERQDLAGLDRDRVRSTGKELLAGAESETV